MYEDDAKLIADMLKDQWSLDIGQELVVAYEPSGYMIDSRVGSIYVYLLNRSNRIASADYRTLERHTRVSIRVSNQFRNNHFLWCDEVYRILMANRRAGKGPLGGNTYLEVLSDRTQNDLSGWHTTTIDIDLVSFNTPLRTAGFGDRINRKVADRSARIIEGDRMNEQWNEEVRG